MHLIFFGVADWGGVENIPGHEKWAVWQVQMDLRRPRRP
jgi:hypothetical protein